MKTLQIHFFGFLWQSCPRNFSYFQDNRNAGSDKPVVVMSSSQETGKLPVAQIYITRDESETESHKLSIWNCFLTFLNPTTAYDPNPHYAISIDHVSFVNCRVSGHDQKRVQAILK